MLSGSGAVELWSGHLDQAARTLASGVTAATAPGAEDERADCRGHLALVEALRGRLDRAGTVAAQMIARRGRQCGVDVWTHRFRHHFSHTWLDRGGAEGDLMELNGWSSPQMLRRYGASARSRSARARRSYDRIMPDRP